MVHIANGEQIKQIKLNNKNSVYLYCSQKYFSIWHFHIHYVATQKNACKKLILFFK